MIKYVPLAFLLVGCAIGPTKQEANASGAFLRLVCVGFCHSILVKAKVGVQGESGQPDKAE